MTQFQVAHQKVELDRDTVEAAVERVPPEPIQEHYVVVRGRRYPPKQVLTCATGLDRADFTTHQARRILLRLGFSAARRTTDEEPEAVAQPGLPHGGRQASALAPYAGQWVALRTPTEVLVGGETPEEILSWLARHGLRAAYGMFRVPDDAAEAGGAAPS